MLEENNKSNANELYFSRGKIWGVICGLVFLLNMSTFGNVSPSGLASLSSGGALCRVVSLLNKHVIHCLARGEIWGVSCAASPLVFTVNGSWEMRVHKLCNSVYNHCTIFKLLSTFLLSPWRTLMTLERSEKSLRALMAEVGMVYLNILLQPSTNSFSSLHAIGINFCSRLWISWEDNNFG